MGFSEGLAWLVETLNPKPFQAGMGFSEGLAWLVETLNPKPF
jgi:hypothetical protein